MRNLQLILIAICFIFAGCKVITVGFFEVNRDIPDRDLKLEALTVSFRSAIEDSFDIQSSVIGKTKIYDYKKTLSVAFRNTFSSAFKTVLQYNNFSTEGISVVVSEMKPSWYEKSESSTGTETSVRFNYKIVLYKDGQWVREFSKQSVSLLSYRVTSKPGTVIITENTPVMVLRSGLKEACADIYNEVMKDLTSSSTAGSGTGFLISNDGYVITNAHVVENAQSLMIKGVNGDFTQRKAILVTEDKANDLALLKIENFKTDSIPFSLRTKGLETGEDVFVLGYPLIQTMGEEIKLTKGIISSKTGFQGNASTYQISAAVQPGNSGSPVFDAMGSLIGIANAKHRDAEGVTYVIKPSFIRTLFSNADIELSVPEKSKLESLSLAQKTKILSPYIYIIIRD